MKLPKQIFTKLRFISSSLIWLSLTNFQGRWTSLPIYFIPEKILLICITIQIKLSQLNSFLPPVCKKSTYLMHVELYAV